MTQSEAPKTYKERPILCSGTMVCAILDGRKTQERRIVKGAVIPCDTVRHATRFDRNACDKTFEEKQSFSMAGSALVISCRCPFGNHGDRLWVKETHYSTRARCRYRADNMIRMENGSFASAVAHEPKWKPSIFMRRRDSRITLEIAGVRVERLNEISEADALAEGVTLRGMTRYEGEAKDAYRVLWESIHGPGSWDANPWVWVIEFQRMPEDAR